MFRHSRSIIHFVILLVLLSLFSFLIIYFSGNIAVQALLVVLLSFNYLLWGVIHHLKTEDFSLKIMLEYLLICLLGASTLIFIIIRV